MRQLLLLLAVGSLLAAGENARIAYTKVFKGSVPDYVGITVDRSGHATYKEAADDDRPLQFDLLPADVSEIFQLSDKLDHFSRPLESKAKVANMGMKTFRYEDGAAHSEVKFNYSEDPDARLLADWFERISETEQTYIRLERAIKFDKLGVNQALVQLQIEVEKKRLLAPQQFLGLLDRVVANDSYMHMSRERAASLAEAFRKPSPDKGDK